MSDRSFLDTNVLLYTDDRRDLRKNAIALGLLADVWSTGTAVISTQVLQEYFSAATRKLGVDTDTARRKVELLDALEIVGIDHRDVVDAVDLHKLHTISFWDALIVKCAQKSACKVLLTEDLQHGRRFGDVELRNPFIDD